MEKKKSWDKCVIEETEEGPTVICVSPLTVLGRSHTNSSNSTTKTKTDQFQR